MPIEESSNGSNKKMKVIWTPENDRKLLIRLIDKSAKSYNSEALCKLFEGATPKAIEERIAKLKREAKALDKAAGVPITPSGKGGKAVGNVYTTVPATGSHTGSSPSLKKRMLREAVDDEEVDVKSQKTPIKGLRGGAASAAMKKLKLQDAMTNEQNEGMKLDLLGNAVSVKKDEPLKI